MSTGYTCLPGEHVLCVHVLVVLVLGVHVLVVLVVLVLGPGFKPRQAIYGCVLTGNQLGVSTKALWPLRAACFKIHATAVSAATSPTGHCHVLYGTHQTSAHVLPCHMSVLQHGTAAPTQLQRVGTVRMLGICTRSHLKEASSIHPRPARVGHPWRRCALVLPDVLP